MGYAKNQDIAEEAIQNAFVYIIQNKEKYLELSCKDFFNSVVIIVRDRCKNIFKSRKLYLEKFIEKDIDEVENLTNNNCVNHHCCGTNFTCTSVDKPFVTN